MTADSWGIGLVVLVVALSLWGMPALAGPTVPFGVRVPPDKVSAPVIRQERRSYSRRTAVLGVCFTVGAIGLATGSHWWAEAIVLVQLGTGFGCFWLARERITAVKTSQGWFEGRRQTVVADTTWRSEPERFPRLWAAPAVIVILATLAIGAVRYGHLPARLGVHFTAAGVPDGWAATSVWSAFSLVVTQLFTTALITGLMLITYRSRPDADPLDAAGSTRRYRVFLAAMSRAVLTLAALVNVSLLLASLQIWGVLRLTGAGALLLVVPDLIGVLVVVAVAFRTGQSGSRLPHPEPARSGDTGVSRDDDRFWKGGVIYINRDDPAIMVAKRFGVGWTVNFGNGRALLLLGAIAAATAALALWSAVVGR